VFLLAADACFADTNVPGSDALLRLRPPLPEIPPTFWERNNGWIVAAGLLLFVAIAAFVAWLMRPKPPVVVPPDVQARKALEPLRGQPEDGALLSRVSQILRHYVAAAFALQPGEMTTADFCRAVAGQARVGEELSNALSAFLRHCDERKFAPSTAIAAGNLPASGGGILPPEAPSAPAMDTVAQALELIQLAEARRAQLPPLEPATPAPQGPRAYRGATKH
jgi:Domain of unknown function (DUF4381)